MVLLLPGVRQMSQNFYLVGNPYPMLSKEEFLAQASSAYDEWLAQNPTQKDAYDYEKDFESWFLAFGRKILEGSRRPTS